MKIQRTAQTLAFMVSVFTLFPGVTEAACHQGNLTGTWYAHGVVFNLAADRAENSYSCTIKIGSGGKVKAKGSSCKSRDWDGVSSGGNIKGGALRVSSSCTVTGKIKICDSSGCYYAKFDPTHMSRDKLTILGNWYVESDTSTLASFQALKK